MRYGVLHNCLLPTVIVTCTLYVGCVNRRGVITPLVPDMGPHIETRNKYRISEVAFRFKDGKVRTDNSAELINFYQTILKNQPGVFSEHGMPFRLTVNTSSTKHEQKGGWTFLMFIATVGILPIYSEYDVHIDLEISVQGDTVAPVCLHHKGASATTLFSPIAKLVAIDEYKADAGHRGFNKCTDKGEALAYGLAVRLKELEEAGKISVGRIQAYNTVTPSVSVEPHPIEPPKQESNSLYSILSCKREAGSDFSYRFELELLGKNNSLHVFRTVQQEFRQAVKEDYVESVPGVKKQDLYVEFPEYELRGGKIEGRAVVLSISVTSLSYDPNTRTGKLAVKVNANQYEEARKWIRKNIETLARDKNIALVTDEIPPAAKFYLGREELKDGNVLEIEFKTE